MPPKVESGSPMRPALFRILDRQEEIPGCLTLRVEPESDEGDSGFKPGQFYMAYVFGHGEVPISVSGNPASSKELSFTVMEVGSVTRALCAAKLGTAIGLRGPFGSAWPVEKVKGRNVIAMAGGLGLAPLRPALYHMLQNRNDYGDLTLLYGARQPQSILFQQQLDNWRAQAPINIDITVDAAEREWLGEVGIVTELLKGRSIDPAQTSALICGPEIMMRFSAYALLDLGVAAENIHISMERNMKCAVKMCGRCQYGPYFICHEGPVLSFDRVERLFKIREV